MISDISFVLFAKHLIPVHGGCVHGEYFGLAFMIAKLCKIMVINDLHFSQRCTDKKIHVSPHIRIPYSPLICDI